MAASPTPAATPEPRALLIFDGDCGFCTTTANWFADHIGSREAIAAWQQLDLAALGLTQDQVTAAAYWIGSDGSLHRGHSAIGQALIHVGYPWKALGLAITHPPVSSVASIVYGLVSKNRFRLPGSTDACKLNP